MQDDKDPKTLTDEELDAILNPTEEQEPEAPVDPVEDAPDKGDDEPDPKEEVDADKPEKPEAEPPKEDEPAEDEPKPPSRREQLRIQDILAKRSQAQSPSTFTPKPDEAQLNYAQELNADPEVIQRLEADRQRSSDQSYQQAFKQMETLEWRTALRIEAPAIEKKFPALDRTNEAEFHPVLADSINRWYMNTVGYDPETKIVANPSIGYGEFVEGIYELAEEMAGNKIATTTANIKKQAAATGLRPDGSATKMNLNKAPEAMSDDELTAYLKTQGL